MLKWLDRWFLELMVFAGVVMLILSATGVHPQKSWLDSPWFWGLATVFWSIILVFKNAEALFTQKQRIAIRRVLHWLEEFTIDCGNLFGLRNISLDDEMRSEIVRLGEDTARFAQMARREGLRSTRSYLQRLTDSADQFEKWFPRLQQFAVEKRQANPLPEESNLTRNDLAVRRILTDKIAHSEGQRTLRKYEATIVTAPLVVHRALLDQWPDRPENLILLTQEEENEWWKIYGDSEECLWWYVCRSGKAEFHPEEFGKKVGKRDFSIPPSTTPLLIDWGIQDGVLSGFSITELWCVDQNSRERFICELNSLTF